MKSTPIDSTCVTQTIDSLHISDFGQATIREIVTIVNRVESETGEQYIRMEMGVPGLPAPQIGVDAEIKALQQGVASSYPMLDGYGELKKEASRFIEAFMDVKINPAYCIPVTGSMQGTFASFLVAGQCDPNKNKILFIDPGFPVQKQQLTVLGYDWESFDIYDYRGDKLAAKIESYLQKGNIAAIIYSNPNNPSWVCLKQDELQTIAQLATQYDVIVIEDLAYFAMDFRKECSHPFCPPYQPTIAHYTEQYILLISGSKAFSYAGQRIGIAAISDKLYQRNYPALQQRYGVETFGGVYVGRVIYALSSGTSHSAQYALSAMFKAASDGSYDFIKQVQEYGRRAALLKQIFITHGFSLVYSHDLEEPIADGFYFTVSYPNMSGAELMKELLYYGISAICLDTTGSNQQGVRACTSFIKEHQYELLDQRLSMFAQDHPTKHSAK